MSKNAYLLFNFTIWSYIIFDSLGVAMGVAFLIFGLVTFYLFWETK